MNDNQQIFSELIKITLGNTELFYKVLQAHCHNLERLKDLLQKSIQNGGINMDELSATAHKAKASLLTLQQPKLLYRLYDWIEHLKNGHYSPPEFLDDILNLLQMVHNKLAQQAK